jgi:hypothetical protein
MHACCTWARGLAGAAGFAARRYEGKIPGGAQDPSTVKVMGMMLAMAGNRGGGGVQHPLGRLLRDGNCRMHV